VVSIAVGSSIEQMTTDIVDNIDQHLEELRGEIAKLKNARTALTTRPASSASPQAHKPQPKATQASPQRVPTGKLSALLTGSDGMTTRELAAATHGQQSQILALLRELEQTDQVRRSGQRRGTRWHLITDEDRTATRVAVLSRRKR
jgi:hypothetical protein